MLFNQSMPQSAQALVEAQFRLLSDMSQQLLSSVQRFNALNLQAAQAMMQESLDGARQTWSAQDPYEALSIAAGQAQPAAEKLRAYQQHLADIAARAQVDLNKTAEKHMPETSRTAAVFADDIARMASEASRQATQRQRATLDKLSTPFGGRPAATGANVH